MRFEFGDNWSKFLKVFDEARLQQAEDSLRRMLEVDSLKGLRFLDVGCGSGLFSLAARRLGATVHSFDCDPASVECARTLKQTYDTPDGPWTIETASVLDTTYLEGLGSFDVVYAWGVLHHTGAMWQALANLTTLLKPGGKLFLAIYNDQGKTSRRWWKIKRLYNQIPKRLRFLILWPAALWLWGPTLLKDLLKLRPFRSWRLYRERRGMSPWRDVVDWVGGFPFEVAKPEEVFDFCRARGLVLDRLVTCGGSFGCNQFVFHMARPAVSV